MDWSGCELVEVIEGKVSGRPIVVGTRIPADVIVSNYEAGLSVEEVQHNYPGLTIEMVEALLAYAHKRQLQTAR